MKIAVLCLSILSLAPLCTCSANTLAIQNPDSIRSSVEFELPNIENLIVLEPSTHSSHSNLSLPALAPLSPSTDEAAEHITEKTAEKPSSTLKRTADQAAIPAIIPAEGILDRTPESTLKRAIENASEQATEKARSPGAKTFQVLQDVKNKNKQEAVTVAVDAAILPRSQTQVGAGSLSFSKTKPEQKGQAKATSASSSLLASMFKTVTQNPTLLLGFLLACAIGFVLIRKMVREKWTKERLPLVHVTGFSPDPADKQSVDLQDLTPIELAQTQTTDALHVAAMQDFMQSSYPPEGETESVAFTVDAVVETIKAAELKAETYKTEELRGAFAETDTDTELTAGFTEFTEFAEHREESNTEHLLKSDQVMALKLELAHCYLDVNEVENALPLLIDVEKFGTPAEKEMARQLLSRAGEPII